MGGHFLGASFFKGPKGGHPPKKIQFCLGYFVSKYIDRNSQEI